jgi:hypothetical protein
MLAVHREGLGLQCVPLTHCAEAFDVLDKGEEGEMLSQ